MRTFRYLLAAVALLAAQTAGAVSVDLKEYGLTRGEGLDEVKEPLGVAADREGRLLLTDKGNKKLLLYTTDGKFRFAFPSRQSKKLEQPSACAIGPGGSFYVVDADKKAVYRFDEAGERQSVGSRSLFAEPMAVAADDSGRVFVVDRKTRMLVGLSAGGDRLPGYQVVFDEPQSVAADRLGRAYVADGKKGILFVFKADGQIARELSLSTGAAKDGMLKKPVGVAVNTHGEIFVLDEDDRKVFYKRGIDDPNWQVLFGGEGDAPGEFKRPVALAVAGRDRVFVLDRDAPKLARATVGDLPAIPPLGQSDLLSAQDTVTILPEVQASFSEPQIVISRVERDAGRVYFSVLRPNGMPETGLRASNLEFLQGGQPVTGVRLGTFGEDPQAHLMVVLGFGTSTLARIEEQRVKTAIVEKFLADLVESKPDRAALLTFDNDISVPAHFTPDPFRLKEELNRLDFSGDHLRFYDGILAGKDLIRQTDTTGFGALVYLVDARDQGSKYDIFQLERETTEGDFPPVYLLGVGVDAESQLAGELARVCTLTHGAHFFTPPLGENYASVYKHIIRILQNQYIATFPSPLSAGILEIGYVRSDGERVAAEYTLKSAAVSTDAEGREVMAPTGLSTLQWILVILLILLVVLLVVLLIRALIARSRSVPPGWRLAVRRGLLRGKAFDLVSAQTRIGSAEESDIVVPDDRVSRAHAVLRWEGGRFTIEDLASTNHTFVNGKQVSRAALKAGDLISLAGAVDMVLEGGR